MSVWRLSEFDVIEMRERWRRGATVNAMAARFRVDWDTANNAIFGVTHASVACPVTVIEREARYQMVRAA